MDSFLFLIYLDQLSAYSEIAKAVEDHWAIQLARIQAHLEEAARSGDDEYQDWLSGEWDDLESFQILPQRVALFMGLWASFESMLVRFAGEVRHIAGHQGKWKPKGHYISSALETLENDGGHPSLSPDRTETLEFLRDLRNCFTHSQGILEGVWKEDGFVPNENHGKLEAWLLQQGLGQTDVSQVVINEKFIPWVAAFLREILGASFDAEEAIRPSLKLYPGQIKIP